MSVTQPVDTQTAPNLKDVTLSLELALETINSDLEISAINPQLSITQALETCWLFAEANHLESLASYIRQEIDGYKTQPPSDRLVQLSYFDIGGQVILGLEQYAAYPLTTGTRKLESHLKNGLTLMLPKQITNFLSQVIGRQVESGHISPSEVKKMLLTIGNNIKYKLATP